MLTSDRTIRWIENLAEQERLIKTGERASIDLCDTKDEVLSMETASFVADLYHHFEYLVRLFNSRVEKSELQIKLVKHNDKDAGFSMERNDMKFFLSASQPGKVTLQCQKIILGEDKTSTAKTSFMFSGVIESKFGKFHDVEWKFLGAKVNAEQVSRHYLTEFIQVSRTQ